MFRCSIIAIRLEDLKPKRGGFYVELINFLVAPLLVQVVKFSPPHVAPPLDRDDAMIRRGQLLLLLLYAIAL